MDKEVLEKVDTEKKEEVTPKTSPQTVEKAQVAPEVKENEPQKKTLKSKILAKKEEVIEPDCALPPVKEEKEKKEELSNYLKEFKDLTLKDVKKEKVEEKVVVAPVVEPKVVEEPKIEYQKVEKVKKTTLIIEKPNYDLMPQKKGNVKKRKNLKTALLACALAVCSIGCVAGAVALDNMNAHYMQLEDSYSLNLIDYLNKINNLNATNKGFEFIETYPEEKQEISSIGESTNWFDNLTNFITGVFGG